MEYKIFYETGRLKTTGFLSVDGFTSNVRTYDPEGVMFTMEPHVGLNSDTIVLGDTLVVRGTLDNIYDHRFSSGFMIVGNKFYDDTMKYSLIDTLAITSSKFNDYTLSLIPENKGDFKFVIQFAYRFNKSLNVDTLAFFSNEGKIFVK